MRTPGHGHDHAEGAAAAAAPEGGHGDGHGHSAHGHAEHGGAAEEPKKKRKKKKHDLSQVSSVGFKFPGNFDVPKFNMFMSTLLQVGALAYQICLPSRASLVRSALIPRAP